MERYDEFRQAYEQARTTLSALPNVIGVGHGPKITHGEPTGDYAIIAYVDQKIPLDQIPVAERVPSQFQNWLTDVKVPEMGDVHVDDDESHDPHHHSHDGMWLNWIKLHAMQGAQVGAIAATAPPPLQAGSPHVAVLQDDGTLIMPNGRVDFVAAFKKFKAQYGDVYDFVTFFMDRGSGVPDNATFHSGIYNQTRGVNYYASDHLDDRRAWGSTKLQAFHCFSFISMGALLQEMGHMWGSYVTVKHRPDDSDFHFDLLIGDNRNDINQVAHWGRAFNDEDSPMDYDGVQWMDNGDGTFTLTPVADEKLAYCDLDLYLMGLLPPEQVKPFYVVQNSRDEGISRFAAQRLDLSAQNVIWAHGPRVPAHGQTAFRQAFIVITKDAANAGAFVEEVDQWRTRYEQAFARATRNLARVNTALSPAPPVDTTPSSNPLADFFNALAAAIRRLFGRA